jgi:hemerythrin-like domain-containing protein
VHNGSLENKHTMPTQDAIALLKEDHKKVKALLKELESTTERAVKKRTTLLAQIETELQVHTKIEESIFYPAFREAVDKEDRKMYFEAIEEHHVVKLILPEIKGTDPATEVFGAKAKVLKELVEHHAEEEEAEMFPEARKVLSRAELVSLGEQMATEKKRLLGTSR